MSQLQDKVAIVTGAGSGIGRAIAQLFAAEGASIIVADIDEQGGQSTVSDIEQKGGKAVFVTADSSNPQDSKHAVEQAVKHFGGLHIACNNAGISGKIAAIDQYPVEEWDKVISINLSGVFYGLRYQIPAMMESGGGCIINIASILGAVGAPDAPAYVAAKHGVVGLTKAAALDVADQNIRINAVGPGYISTPLIEQAFDQDALAAITKLHPIGRLGQVAEVAELVLWLSTDKASFVTGAYFPVDGGYLAQ